MDVVGGVLLLVGEGGPEARGERWEVEGGGEGGVEGEAVKGKMRSSSRSGRGDEEK